MALFLSEAVDNYERKQVSRGTTDLAEAALTLLSISEQSAALTEAVMTAEFTLMRQCQNLSEGETSNKMKDFGRKVWHNLKAFAKTVWAKIKEICRMVWRKLKEWGSQVLDMFSGKEMEIEKEDYKLLSDGPRILEKIINVTERGITTSDDAGSDLLDTAKELTKELEDLKKAAQKDQKENVQELRAVSGSTRLGYNHKAYIKVGKNWLKSVQSTISGYATKIEKLAEIMDKKVEEMEKLEGRMSHEDNQKDLNKSAVKLKEGIEMLKVLATNITTLTTKLTKVGRAVTSGEKSDSGKELESIAKYVEANKAKFTNVRNFDTLLSDIRAGWSSALTINLIKGSSLEEKEKDKLIDRLEAHEELRNAREEEYNNKRS